MSTSLSIRNYVHFRRLFDAVHPFFWPVLYWQLKKAWIILQREKLTGVLLAVTWWGGVRIAYRGDRIETPKHDPLAPTKPRWDDPVWSMDVPPRVCAVAALETMRLLPILPCKAGEVSPKVTEGAHPLHSLPNTS